MAGAAAAESGTPLWAIVAVAALGAVAGDSVSFWLGRRFGTDVIDRWRWVKRRWTPRLRRAQHHFERRGGLSVAVARWVGALRAVVPVVAGTAGMPYRTLLVWDAPSALGWSAVVATLGFVLGDDIASVVDRLGLVVSLAAVTVIAVTWAVRRHRRE